MLIEDARVPRGAHCVEDMYVLASARLTSDMEDNLQELLAQGLRPADPRRKSSPRKRSNHRTSQSQVSEEIPSESSTAESDADSQDSLSEDDGKPAQSGGISKTNSKQGRLIRKSHRAAPAEHLELLRQSLDKVQPQKKEDFMLAYNLAAKKVGSRHVQAEENRHRSRRSLEPLWDSNSSTSGTRYQAGRTSPSRTAMLYQLRKPAKSRSQPARPISATHSSQILKTSPVQRRSSVRF